MGNINRDKIIQELNELLPLTDLNKQFLKSTDLIERLLAMIEHLKNEIHYQDDKYNEMIANHQSIESLKKRVDHLHSRINDLENINKRLSEVYSTTNPF